MLKSKITMLSGENDDVLRTHCVHVSTLFPPTMGVIINLKIFQKIMLCSKDLKIFESLRNALKNKKAKKSQKKPKKAGFFWLFLKKATGPVFFKKSRLFSNPAY